MDWMMGLENLGSNTDGLYIYIFDTWMSWTRLFLYYLVFIAILGICLSEF